MARVEKVEPLAIIFVDLPCHKRHIDVHSLSGMCKRQHMCLHLVYTTAQS